MDLEQARFFMVEQQIRPWDVLDPKILDLLMETPRHEFVPTESVKLAYSDIQLSIGHEQAMLEPKVEGRLLQALDIQGDEKALEIGTGIGYVTALMSKLAETVTSIEIIPALQATAKDNLTGYDNITFETGDASNGWNDNKQYDAILFSGSMETLPTNYKNKLTIGGRLVVTLGHGQPMVAQLVTRVSEGEWQTEALFETMLKPLTNATQKNTFSF